MPVPDDLPTYKGWACCGEEYKNLLVLFIEIFITIKTVEAFKGVHVVFRPNFENLGLFIKLSQKTNFTVIALRIIGTICQNPYVQDEDIRGRY